ncbi:MAG: hypothetical protein ISS57_09320 [Anaerolineales bacterium]|nr:hypothetical protein [Anaerolineales bacterium]
MNKLRSFLKSRWDEIIVLGVALQLILWAITTGNLVIILAVTVSMIVMVLMIYGISERISARRLHKSLGDNIAFQVSRRGLIFTVGKQTHTIEYAIQKQQPEFIAVICTDVTENQATEIMAKFSDDPEMARKRLVDPFDLVEIRATTQSLIKWLEQKIPKDAIAVDITGGMTTMSIGAFLAADEAQIDTQYVRSNYDLNNKPVVGSQDGIFIARFSDSGEITQ